MYSIRPRLSNNYSTTEELNALISEVDSAIVRIGITALNNYKFGFNKNVEIDKYKDLLKYKNMLLKKLLACNCLKDVMILKIVSKLKKLIK